MINVANWLWPQWAYVSMILASLLILANKHGKAVEVKFTNFWRSIAFAIPIWAILICGGFFK